MSTFARICIEQIYQVVGWYESNSTTQLFLFFIASALCENVAFSRNKSNLSLLLFLPLHCKITPPLALCFKSVVSCFRDDTLSVYVSLLSAQRWERKRNGNTQFILTNCKSQMCSNMHVNSLQRKWPVWYTQYPFIWTYETHIKRCKKPITYRNLINTVLLDLYLTTTA